MPPYRSLKYISISQKKRRALLKDRIIMLFWKWIIVGIIVYLLYNIWDYVQQSFL